MPLVRYVPGPIPDLNWDETFVDEPEDGSEPTRYQHHGSWFGFNESLTRLVARGAWQRAVDPDLVMDEGL